ncbi:unnamed protein product, partial [Sphagnum balticum]
MDDPDSTNQRTAADGTNTNREVQREQRSSEERAAWQNIMQNYNYYQSCSVNPHQPHCKQARQQSMDEVRFRTEIGGDDDDGYYFAVKTAIIWCGGGRETARGNGARRGN